MIAPADVVTHFAPAARAGRQQVACQAQVVAADLRLGDVLDHVPDLLMVVNRQRQVVFANQRLLALLGLEGDEPILGQRPGEVLDCVHAREMPGGCGTSEHCRNCGAVLAILSGLEGRRAVRECRLTVMHPGGEEQCLDLQVWVTPLIVEGETYSFMAVSDKSDQKRRQALERIFFHDILNTAGGVAGFANLLRDSLNGQHAALADTLVMAAETLVQEIQAQRDLLAAERDELQVNPAFFSASQFLERQVRLARSRQVDDSRPLEMCLPDADLCLISDQVLLGRVVGNMLKNALEASQTGQSVQVGLERREGGLEFWVRNRAPMPHQVQLQIFKRSFSTKGTGRGLGTYSMKLLTERYLGGRVSFSSQEGEGTTFRAWVPEQLETA